jgi:uncharacterized protein
MDKQKSMNLTELLAKNKQWPLMYMFKFIVPNQNGKVDEVVVKLPKHGNITYKHTPNLKYVAITCVASMESAESIVAITTQATSIEGVMAL